MTAVRVQVTQQDIDDGKAGEAYRCPVALAARRAFPRQHVRVYAPCIMLIESGYPTFDLPSEARRFVDRFDGGVHVEPFEFDLDVPDDLLAGAS